MGKKYNPEKLTAELAAAGIQTTGCNEHGTIFWQADPATAELVAAQTVLDSHNPDPEPDPLEPYKAVGITPEVMLRALWEAGGGKDGMLPEQIKGKKGEI